ncbi:MAG: hypothetical protein ACI8TF_002240 [Paracoccaceae bacterium]|jgi:hypothetical protein
MRCAKFEHAPKEVLRVCARDGRKSAPDRRMGIWTDTLCNIAPDKTALKMIIIDANLQLGQAIALGG